MSVDYVLTCTDHAVHVCLFGLWYIKKTTHKTHANTGRRERGKSAWSRPADAAGAGGVATARRDGERRAPPGAGAKK